MDTGKLVEEKIVSEEETVQSDGHTSSLVDMGHVSKETHGFVHGLEYSFLPKS
jgi:hypothetical protein